MTYLQRKKLAFMSIVNSVKGFLRTVSGALPLILPDCVDNNSLINYTISGNGVGDYDESTGKYKIPVVCSGKNLFDMNDFIKQVQESVTNTNFAPFTGVEDGREYIAISPVGVSAEGRSYALNCKPNTRYTLSFYGRVDSSANTFYVYYTDGTRKTINIDNTTWKRYTVTSEVGKTIESILLVYAYSVYVYYSDFQLEEDTTATDYEPYVEPVITNIYLDEPLADGQILKNPVKLPTFKGTTILSVDTQIQPSNMEVSYYSTSKE